MTLWRDSQATRYYGVNKSLIACSVAGKDTDILSGQNLMAREFFVSTRGCATHGGGWNYLNSKK